jgi:hypothetical protein
VLVASDTGKGLETVQGIVSKTEALQKDRLRFFEG